MRAFLTRISPAPNAKVEVPLFVAHGKNDNLSDSVKTLRPIASQTGQRMSANCAAFFRMPICQASLSERRKVPGRWPTHFSPASGDTNKCTWQQKLSITLLWTSDSRGIRKDSASVRGCVN